MSIPAPPTDVRTGVCHDHGPCLCAEIIAHVGLGVVVFDLDHRAVSTLNESARETFARLHLPTDYDSLHAALVPPGVDLRRLSGPYSAEPLRLRSRLISYTLHASGPFAWALLQDITEKARLEAIAEAVEMMNNIGFVFTALRHELGNPVNSLKAALSVLSANLDRHSRESIAEYIERMRYEVGRVEHLLRSMKSFSMYERHEARPVDMLTFLTSFVRLVSEGAASCGVEVIAHCPEGLCAHCDPRALQQVMLNLFANAVDAVKGRDAPEVHIEAAAQGDLVAIRVRDNGQGLTREQMRDLFRPFFTSKEQGTGLGLVISRKLLARMEGTITLESEEGHGATAVLTLRRCPPAIDT